MTEILKGGMMKFKRSSSQHQQTMTDKSILFFPERNEDNTGWSFPEGIILVLSQFLKCDFKVESGFQSEWVGTTWFQRSEKKDLCFELEEVRYVLQSPRKCTCVDTVRKKKQ